jgi:hypothetical protein
MYTKSSIQNVPDRQLQVTLRLRRSAPLVRAAENTLQGLVIGVRSLKQAEDFLRERGLLGSVSNGLITLDASKVVAIRLVEKN